MKWKIHPLFLLLILASAWTPYLLEILLLFGTVIIHELGHIVVANFYGYLVKEMKLLPFGGVASLEHGSMGWQPRHETVIAIAGPFMNLVMLILAIVLQSFSLLEENIASYLITINLSLAFFNLLPALPLDGGRILRAAYSRSMGFQRATGVAITMAFILSVLLMMIGLLALWVGFVQLGMVTLSVFLFLSAFQLHRQKQYDTIRFLDTKKRQKLIHPLPVRSIAASADTPLLQVLNQFAPDAYHVVYVRDKKHTLRILIEEELMDAAMQPGGVKMPLRNLFFQE